MISPLQVSFLPSPLGVLSLVPRPATVSCTYREVFTRFASAPVVRVVASGAFGTLSHRRAMLDPLTDASGTPFTLTFGTPLHVYR